MIDQHADMAEHFVAQCKRELDRRPARIRADFDRGGFCLVAPSGEPIGSTSTYKRTWLSLKWLAREVA